MKKTIVSMASAVTLGLSSGSVLAAEEVNIGVPSWTGAQAIAHLLQAVVIERIGGEANLVPGNNAIIFQAMSTLSQTILFSACTRSVFPSKKVMSSSCVQIICWIELSKWWTPPCCCLLKFRLNPLGGSI